MVLLTQNRFSVSKRVTVFRSPLCLKCRKQEFRASQATHFLDPAGGQRRYRNSVLAAGYQGTTRAQPWSVPASTAPRPTDRHAPRPPPPPRPQECRTNANLTDTLIPESAVGVVVVLCTGLEKTSRYGWLVGVLSPVSH